MTGNDEEPLESVDAIRQKMMENAQTRMAIIDLGELPLFFRRVIVVIFSVPMFFEAAFASSKAALMCWWAAVTLLWGDDES